MQSLGENDEQKTQILDAMAIMCDRSPRPDTFVTHVREVSKLLIPRIQEGNPQLIENIIEGLYECGIKLSYKAPMYATLVGLISDKQNGINEETSKTMIQKLINILIQNLIKNLRQGLSSTSKRILRYLSCLALSKVIQMESFINQYVSILLDASYFELTSANRSDTGAHCRGLFLAEISLSILPWISNHIQDNKEIVELIDSICKEWAPNAWGSIAPAVDDRCIESFSDLVDATMELRDLDWTFSNEIIPTPYSSFQTELDNGHQIELPPFTIPSHSKITYYCPPRFRLILVNPSTKKINQSIKSEEEKQEIADKSDKNDQKEEKPSGDVTDTPQDKKPETEEKNENKKDLSADVMDISGNEKKSNESKPADETKKGKAEVQEADKIEAKTPLLNLIVRSYIYDVVDNFYTRHLMAAERLLNLPMLKDVNDEIVECLFSQLCSLPKPEFSPVYFGTLFADLCRVKDSRLPAKLLIAVQNMFEYADEFDCESFDRLTDWFSFHLSNFGYKWNWQEWAIYADSDMVDKFPYRALFCKDVIAKCVRLSYFDRIKNFLPDDMKVFLPLPPNDGNYKRFNSNINTELMKVVTGKGRLPGSQVREKLVELIPDSDKTQDETNQIKDGSISNLKRLTSLIRSILHAGCRTLSHFDIVVERYKELLFEMSLNGKGTAKKLITTEVNCFWENVHIRRLYVLDKLAQYHIIDHLSIIDSCLETVRITTDMKHEPINDRDLKLHLANSNWWEIIRLAMQRLKAREDGTRSELAVASKLAAVANEGEMEETEKRLERAKQSTEEVKSEIRIMLLETLKKLFAITAKLLDAPGSSVHLERKPSGNTDKVNDDENVDSHDENKKEGDDSLSEKIKKSNIEDNDDSKVNIETDPMDGDNNNEDENRHSSSNDRNSKMRLPGFKRKPIWYWRCTGMMREVARNHPQHLPHIVPDLDVFTKEMREKHSVLWESFEIIRELEKCSLNTTVQ